MNNKLTVLLAGAVLLALAAPSQATMKIQKEAKAAGFKATNCLYCHNEKMPVKGKVTQNERGTYLIKEKETRKPKDVDVAWPQGLRRTEGGAEKEVATLDRLRA